jgi:hypothetical protein
MASYPGFIRGFCFAVGGGIKSRKNWPPSQDEISNGPRPLEKGDQPSVSRHFNRAAIGDGCVFETVRLE